MSDDNKTCHFNPEAVRDLIEQRLGIEIPMWEYDKIFDDIDYLIYLDKEANKETEDDIKEKAYDEGFEDGEKEAKGEAHEEGYIKGYKRGYALGFEDKQAQTVDAIKEALEFAKLQKPSAYVCDFEARIAMYEEREEEKTAEMATTIEADRAKQRKEEIKASIPPLSIIQQVNAPKKRGRPKGSKNKPKTA